MQSPKPKRKGNAFENKIAKELGLWFFNDKTMLCRHPTSGAIKSAWIGDIIPHKQLPLPWKHWPFFIECKSGYENQTCTLNNQNIIRNWIDKCIKDICGKENIIILLIVNFRGYSPIIITNYKFLLTDPILILVHNKKYYNIYIYKEILKLNYIECFGWDKK